MDKTTVIKFKDLETSDEALAIVQYDKTSVVVGLSLKSNGDMQVVMGKETAKELCDALKEALG